MNRIALVAGAMCAFAAFAQVQAPVSPPPAAVSRWGRGQVIDYRPVATPDGKQAYLYRVAPLGGGGREIEVIDTRIRVYRPGSIVAVIFVEGKASFSATPRPVGPPNNNSVSMDPLASHAPMTVGSH